MRLEEIETPVTNLGGVGSVMARSLANLGIFTIGDLLAHYPRDWDDRTRTVTLADAARSAPLRVHCPVTVIGHAWFAYNRGGGKNGRTLKIKISDGITEGELVAFNRPFLERTLSVGSRVTVTGLFERRFGALQCTAFDTQPENGENANEVIPLYSLTNGISQGHLRKFVKKALDAYGHGIEGDVPADILARRGLLEKQKALEAIHCPGVMADALAGRKSIIYEELYKFQKAVISRSAQRKGSSPPQVVLFPADLSPRQVLLLKSLPFELTEDQKKVISEINADIDHTRMARLLQGDVGSGKTLVAFFAILRITDLGGQSALLAPTELLARQHAENAARLLEGARVRLGFLTGNVSAKGRKPLLDALRRGDVDVVVGTHALFSKSVLYKDLQLAVIDEQHRFGVLQRNAILQKAGGKSPHLLMASATPIPRSLALTVFGDLDVSTIKTVPAGRVPIKTYLSKMGNEQKVYDFVKNELVAGHQAYVVYPRIEGDSAAADGDGGGTGAGGGVVSSPGGGTASIKTAEEMYPVLAKMFSGFSVALVHSRVDEEERHRILDAFRDGEVRVLVATSVVEVGVDNPRATCMVIEHAERFGLAALHQLRGRVGRGTLQSFCFLVYTADIKDTGIARLKALHDTTDGFLIAEEDLKLRGAGEITGIRQSGYLTLGLADPVENADILEMARADILESLHGTLSDTT